MELSLALRLGLKRLVTTHTHPLSPVLDGLNWPIYAEVAYSDEGEEKAVP